MGSGPHLPHHQRRSREQRPVPRRRAFQRDLPLWFCATTICEQRHDKPYGGLDVDEAVVFKCQVEGRRTVRRTVYRGVVHKSLWRRTRAVDRDGMPADEELVVVLENGVGGEVDVALIPSDGAIIDEAPTKRLV